ncbi:hypothetical protein BCR32DRAFT_326254 [Anaeromyces robustus]|uniref:Transglutaminase-like domain-containing protein n=1 Tax=Anaeromyces robustus TaxID=1754192 RepID=A0A1Y1XE67_9FUNG|nr:hypothetical protein BCR32DRAFT_326254 [Anaeromyces robustus]|eukprot:ORX83746.1 hypothetical protein BCR32DRAFT_326254 [Anaeromyces robustus]
MIYESLRNQIESALESGNGLYDFYIYDVPVSNEDEASLAGFRATSAFVMDNPKYFWIGHGNKQSTTTSNNVIKEMVISFNQSYSKDEIINMYNQMVQKIEPVLTVLDTLPSTCEKLKYIHDYLIQNIVYETGDEYSKYNAYGAIVENKSVCEGYAEAFTYICQLVKIPTVIVNSQRHEWNYVKMDDGKWYAMDVTYDDPKIGYMEFKSGDDRNKKYDYFLIGKNSIVTSDNKKIPFKDSSDHQVLDYLLIESAVGIDFPEIADNSYDCHLDLRTNYIQDYFIPNKKLYIYILIGLAALFVLSLICLCVRGIKSDDKNRTKEYKRRYKERQRQQAQQL